MISIAFLFEYIVYSEKFPFNFEIELSKDSWFSFLGSYIGAIASVFIGVVALWQNKQLYKQNEILNKENSKIQNAIKIIPNTNSSLCFEKFNKKTKFLRNDDKVQGVLILYKKDTKNIGFHIKLEFKLNNSNLPNEFLIRNFAIKKSTNNEEYISKGNELLYNTEEPVKIMLEKEGIVTCNLYVYNDDLDTILNEQTIEFFIVYDLYFYVSSDYKANKYVSKYFCKQKIKVYRTEEGKLSLATINNYILDDRGTFIE